MKRSSALAIGATLLLSPKAALAQAPTAMETIKVGAIPAEVGAEVFYGIDQGFFAKNGLNIEFQPFTNGASIAAGVAAGALDLGMSDLVSIISAHSRSVPFVYVTPGLLHGEKQPTYAIIVAKDSDIHSAKDFNGITFGINGIKNISQLGVQAWLDNNGGDSKSVKWVELPFPSMSRSVAQEIIQAAAPPEPFLTAAAESGMRVVFMDRKALAPIYMVNGYVAMRDWVANHLGAAEKFRISIRQIAEWANKNQAASSPILAKYSKTPLPVIEHMHRGEFATHFDVAQIQPMIEAAVKYGVIAKSFPASELILGNSR